MATVERPAAREDQGMRAAARKIAHAIRQGSQAHAEREGPGRYRATVRRWGGESSFELDVQGQDETADENDVTFSQEVRRTIRDTGIDEGDVFVLVEIDDLDYAAVAVESEHSDPGRCPDP